MNVQWITPFHADGEMIVDVKVSGENDEVLMLRMSSGRVMYIRAKIGGYGDCLCGELDFDPPANLNCFREHELVFLGASPEDAAKMVSDREERRRTESARLTEEHDRAEYERLQKKFGGK